MKNVNWENVNWERIILVCLLLVVIILIFQKENNTMLRQDIEQNITTIGQDTANYSCQSEFDKCVEVARGLYVLNQEGVCLK